MINYIEYFKPEELEYARKRSKFKTLPKPEEEEKVRVLLSHLPASKDVDYEYQEFLGEKD